LKKNKRKPLKGPFSGLQKSLVKAFKRFLKALLKSQKERPLKEP
jgi:hypothetical protein